MAAEVLYVRVTSVPRKLTADRRVPEAWGKFYVLSGPRGGEEHWFTGPVFVACKLLKPGIVVTIKGEFLPKGASGISRDGFYVRDVTDIVIAPDGKVLDAISDITGVRLTENEYATCLSALGATSLQQAAGMLVTRKDVEDLACVVGDDIASRFAALCSWEQKWGADMLEGLFRACGLEDKIDIALIWLVVKALRFRAARNGMSVASLVERYPYVLMQVWDDDVLAMKAARTISQAVKGCVLKEEEAAAAAIAALRTLMGRGHCFAWENQMSAAMYRVGAKDDDVQRAWQLLYSPEGRRLYGGLHSENDGTNISLRQIAKDVGLYPNKKFRIDKDAMPKAVYAPGTYWSERDAAAFLASVIGSDARLDLDQRELVAAAERAAAEEGCQLDPGQREFIRQVAENKITVLVGEAGTGKTQAIRWLIKALNEVKSGFVPHVLAPTALAAYRAARKTVGATAASTIHRYASFFMEEADYFVEEPVGRKVQMPGLVIVDECSMLGPVLLAKLLRNTAETTRFVFAGDPAQLQPVGPAGTYTGLIRLASEGVPGMALVELSKNYRADAGSEVYMAAREVRRGKPVPDGLKQVRVVYVKDDNEAVARCVDVVDKLVGKVWPAVPGEVLVLTPYRSKKVGAEQLNRVLAKYFSGGSSDMFALGTPVVARRNDYAGGPGLVPVNRWANRHPQRDRDVYNGTPGVVKAIRRNGREEVCIAYTINDEVYEAWYYRDELSYYVEPAYAMTVHKAQGAEGRHVVLVLTGAFSHRSLLYTALSRCKDDPAGTGSVTIITLKQFAKAPYALPDWEKRVIEEVGDDIDEIGELPLPAVLSGFYHRARQKIWSSLPNYVPPVKGDGVWLPEGEQY